MRIQSELFFVEKNDKNERTEAKTPHTKSSFGQPASCW